MSRKGLHHDKVETDSCRESRSYSLELEKLNKDQAISAALSRLFSKQP